MHLFLQILSQYLGPQEAQLYSELQSKAKPLVKLSEEIKNKLEAETGTKKLAAVIVKKLENQEVSTDCRCSSTAVLHHELSVPSAAENALLIISFMQQAQQRSFDRHK